MRTKEWRNCDECGVKYHSLHNYGKKSFCWNCYIKKIHYIHPGGRHEFTLKKALKKTYVVRVKSRHGWVNAGIIQVPKALIGKKVKLELKGGKS